MKWQDRAIELKRTLTWADTARQIHKEYFSQDSEQDVYERVRSYIRRENKRQHIVMNDAKDGPAILAHNSGSADQLLSILKNGCNMQEISEEMGMSERVAKAMIDDLVDKGHCIDEINGIWRISKSVAYQENKYQRDWNGDKIIRFGVASDAHMGSLWQQLTHLNAFYDLCQQEGIPTVYNPGDLTEGVNMRPGHEFEVFVHGCDAQAQYVVDHYPMREGITTEFITGNHDHSGIKHAGHDIGTSIARARPDMIYLGRANAKINITPNCNLMLNHPLDGASYALSYVTQKTIDAMKGGKKPNILLNGHHHKAFYLFYRNIHALECGTFQDQTPFLLGKRIDAMVGGWIVEAHVDDDGTITRFKPEFIPFYNSIENDYQKIH